MNCRKGFTLVELLAVMVILGIITLISLPLIRNISVEAEKRQYDAYRDSLKSAAKLYMDSNAKDIFGRKGVGCYPVTYEQLYERGLVKDISLRDISCHSDSTYVLVFKTDDNFSYSPNLGCGKVVNGVVSLSEGASLPDAACSVSASTIMNIQATPDKDESYFKSKNVTVTITSYTGINTQSRISYGISTDPNSDTPEGGWHPLPMDIMDKEDQKKSLLNATPIVVTTKLNKLFEGLTGNYYLILKVEHLTNLDGDNWNDGSSNRVSFGAYKVDNEAPKWNDSKIVSSEEGYNAIIPKLDLKVTDVLTSTLTGEEATANSLRMCITYDNEEACPTTVKEIRKMDGSRYEVYNPAKILKKIQGSYVTANASSHNHTIYVTVADRAGNYITKSFGYKVAYQVTYDKNTGTGTTNPTYCDEGVNCILRGTGFTKAGYKFDGWFLATSGGNVVTSLTLTKDTTVYAHWSACGAGSYSNNNQCSTCPANTYSDGSANASCTACPGRMTSAAGSSVKTACKITCTAGNYLKKNESACSKCPVGSYCSGGTYNFNASSDQGITTCPGSMTSAAGSSAKTACKITCDAGKYLKKNTSACTNCTIGSYCSGGTYNFNASSDQGITTCPGSMTSAAGSSAKTACKITCTAGTYLKKNESACTQCPKDYYCVGGTYKFNTSSDQGIAGCPSGYSSAAGSTAKNKCSIRCSANTRVASVDAKCSACPTNNIISAHTVAAGSTSAACTPSTKKITYNGNGNTRGTTTATTCNYNQSCTLNANGFIKTGYTFDGWYTAASGGTKYGKTTTITTDITVYAHWKDTTGPTLSYSKFNTDKSGGLSVNITCTDSGVGCSQSTYTYHNLKSAKTYTIADKVGNNSSITIPVSSATCSYTEPCEKECGQEQCGAYVCGSHICGRTCYGDGGGYGSDYGSYCAPEYCDNYCPEYCPKYCDDTCTRTYTCYK